jgi:hypothetical protein
MPFAATTGVYLSLDDILLDILDVESDGSCLSRVRCGIAPLRVDAKFPEELLP